MSPIKSERACHCQSTKNQFGRHSFSWHVAINSHALHGMVVNDADMHDVDMYTNGAQRGHALSCHARRERAQRVRA